MFIRKLRPSERAAPTVNHICIDRDQTGMVVWSGSVTSASTAAASAPGAKFRTIQEAEIDAIKWARSQGTCELLIDVSAVC
jgi:hypothetical protein